MKARSKGTRRKLTVQHREHVYRMLDRGFSFRGIEERLSIDHSVLSRDVKRNSVNSMEFRNSTPLNKAILATQKANKRKNLGRKRTSSLSIKTKEHIRHSLVELRHSPEQISGRLKLESSELYVCTNTIYNWVEKEEPELKQFLPYNGKKRSKFRTKNSRYKKTAAPNKKSISELPAKSKTKEILGMWEGDCLTCSQNNSSVLAAVERKSRFLKATKIADRKAETGLSGFGNVLEMEYLFALILDRGSENALHPKIESKLGGGVYFCDPMAPQQKPLIENRNQYLRRFIKKGSDLSKLALHELEKIINRHNNTPLKCLGFKTPAEAYKIEMETLSVTAH